MPIVDIALNLPVAKTFSYIVPDKLMRDTDTALVGRRAEVPFAKRRLFGFIVALRGAPPQDLPAGAGLQEIRRFIDTEPVCGAQSLELAHWLSAYYFCSLGQALAAMIPSGRRGKEARSFMVESAVPDDFVLNSGQQNAVRIIGGAIHANSGQRFLLHGVTGSGKTEVYRHITRIAVEAGQQAVLLVPEIALTPQMISRFSGLFPGRLAILHSSLTPAERIREWRRAASGEALVVIGARSAIFAPVGEALPGTPGSLFIIDEEHESSYKADDCPRYHARQVAFKRTAGRGTLVLGSATPSIETLYHAGTRALTRIPLDERIALHPEQDISIVDMRGVPPGTLVAPQVIEAIRGASARGEQSLVFINRRGYAPSVSCDDCSKTITCPECSVSLTLHREQAALLCHYCGYSIPFTRACPECRGSNLRTSGAGTERVLEFLQKRLPNIRVGRLDSDLAASSKGKLFEVLESFARQEIEVLVGTQMIAKGHDFPNLTVVAVVGCDNDLSLPDFRSFERVYHQLLQVVGRAGRAQKKGFALIQSALPLEDPIASITRGDDAGFHARELDRRRECHWPPFSRLVRVVLRSRDQEHLETAIRALGESLRSANTEKSGVHILGPVPCPIAQKAGYWRQHLLLKCASLAPITDLLRAAGLAEGSRGKAYLEIDVDPQAML
ncbi:MAG: primosomal protein N' [Spirochaetota bacterium]|jgi:primosomal protein N' (replication factor Y)|nr:primosomal protein N' [Spirochaetota bacterium]